MKSVHTRLLNAPIEAVRPWIDRAWSGTQEDVFPRDYIRTWRRNARGEKTAALVPGDTWVGHGMFRFQFAQWDGITWRVELPRGVGHHGFHLESVGEQTRITHTLDASLGVWFTVLIAPIHDWAVESLFDRLEIALTTGAVPQKTDRPMNWRTRMIFRSFQFVRRSRRNSSLRYSRT